MRVDRALEQISEIHEHLAKTELFRGYRAVPAVLSGILAFIAAWIQPFLIEGNGPAQFVFYWAFVAVGASFINGGVVVYKYLREDDSHARRRTLTVAGQYIPSLGVGLIVTIAFLSSKDPYPIAFLPGLWALLYGLGIFSSKPFLPRMIGWLALFYTLCGCFLLRRALVLGLDGLSPWEVGLTFGFGQIIAGCILYWNLERRSHE